MDYKQT